LQFGASLEIRTDEYEYAEQAQQALQEIDSLENLMDGKPWLKAPNNPELHVQTLFEQRFLKKEKPIHYFYLKKKDDDCRS
jgi:tRNA G46 methylase TrmB